MSNHQGSYMLNSILRMLDRYAVFEAIGPEKTQEIVLEMLKVYPYNYDCNTSEILEGLGERFGVCYNCRGPATEFRDGICVACDDEINREFERRRQTQA